jgi:ADP-heptose:LPS heptosyltransferase
MSEPRNILVIRLDRLGDLVCSTPFLKTLRRGFPDSRITLLLRPYTRELLLGCSFIDELLTWPEEKDARPEVLRKIRREKPDLAIALSPIMPAYRLTWQSRARERAGYLYKSRFMPLLLSSFMLTKRAVLDIEGALRRGEPVPHEVEQAMSLAPLLGLSLIEWEMDLCLSDEEKAFAASFLSENKSGQNSLIGLHLHGGWFRTGWTPDDFHVLLRSIKTGFPASSILVTCGPQEKELAEKLAPGLPPGIILAEALTPRQWAALISCCRAFVSLDTGATHLAAAAKVPTVCLFQPETFQLCSRQWAPWRVPCSILEMSSPDKSRREIVKALENLLPSNI